MFKNQPPTHENTESFEDKESTIQERHPDWPELDISFYFGPHGHADNFTEIPERIAESDIYMYENVGVRGFRYDFQQLSADTLGSVEEVVDYSRLDDKPIKGTPWEEIIRGVHGTGKAVSSFDLRGSTKYRRLIEGVLKSNLVKLPIADTFEESVIELGSNIHTHANLQNQREEIMVDRFEDEIEYILANYPHLKDEPRLKVLITMGSVHTTLRHKMAKKGISSSREFLGSTPYIHSYLTELIRTYMYDKVPSQDLLESAYTEHVFVALIQDQVGEEFFDKNYEDMSFYTRGKVSHLNHTQREQIHQLLVYGIPKNWRNEDLIPGVNSILAESGARRLPASAEEIRNDLRAIEQLSAQGLTAHIRQN